MVAKLSYQDKYIYPDGAIREIILWELPDKDDERPHGLKYRLFYGYSGQSLVRYDNERGKGDHRHEGDQEQPCRVISFEQLIEDFRADIKQARGESS